MFKRILFAHNATPASERALLYLEHLARLEQAEVVVLHVYEPPERYIATQGYEMLLEQLEKVAQEVVNDAVEYLQKNGITTIGIVEVGNPARVILETAQSENTTLIIMGTRGPSNVTDIILGDVSMEVLRRAISPIILVP
jgi:nucleotide-binding universal stress UspA family protein